MQRRTRTLGTLTAAALGLSVAPTALAAPAPTVVKVVCDQIGEVVLDVTGTLGSPATTKVHGADGQLTVTPTGSACYREKAAPGGGITSDGEPVAHVTADTPTVVAQAQPRQVQAAASTTDPAGYGPVTSFGYQSQLANWFASRSGSSTIAYRAAGSNVIQTYTRGSSTNVTASIVKVQVLATVMYQAQQQGRGLTAWEKSQIVPMIHYSDNNATTNLWNHIGGGPAVAKVLSLMGLRNTVPGSGSYWGLTVTTAPDQVVLMDHFARSNPVLTSTNRAYGLSLMRTVSSDQDWGVTAGPGTDIAKKNGWLPRADGWHVNSIGYNHKAPRAYSIAVLTHSTTAGMSTQIATIEGASRIVWSHQRPVRGDWNADGRTDLLGISGGSLRLFTAGANRRLAPSVQIGSGWDAMTWIGTPGDVTRDGITDLLARRRDGALLLYRGTGRGGVEYVGRIGTSWNAITAFATVGDFDGDGTTDLLGRTRDGRLVRYRLTTSGAQAIATVGSGWNTMSRLIGVTGINSDARGDLLAIRRDGRVFAYTSTGSRLRSLGEVGHGWSARLVTSPGDLTGDGIDDLAYQTSAGLMTYPVTRGGRIASPLANPGSASGFRLLG